MSKGNESNNDLLVFARETKAKFTDLVENEIKKLKSVKASFRLKVKFSIERNGKTQHIKHYFRETKRHVFNRHDEELIKQQFDEFIQRRRGKLRLGLRRDQDGFLKE